MLALTNILESVRFDKELHARHVEKFAFDFNLCTVLHSLSRTQGSLAQCRVLCNASGGELQHWGLWPVAPYLVLSI